MVTMNRLELLNFFNPFGTTMNVERIYIYKYIRRNLNFLELHKKNCFGPRRRRFKLKSTILFPRVALLTGLMDSAELLPPTSIFNRLPMIFK